MAEPFFVQVNLERLRQNFNLTDATLWTMDRVKDWLRECGFVERADGWLCEEISLEVLSKNEIDLIQPL